MTYNSITPDPKLLAMTQDELMREAAPFIGRSRFLSSVSAQSQYRKLSNKQMFAAAKVITQKREEESQGSNDIIDTPAKLDTPLPMCKTVEAVGDLSAILEVFLRAKESGHDQPAYMAEDLKLKAAYEHGKNPGCINVMADTPHAGMVFRGLINREGKFEFRARVYQDEADKIVNALNTIAADPREAAIRYGRKTGRCSCCGRKLTNKTSVAAGIGPICAEKWGM